MVNEFPAIDSHDWGHLASSPNDEIAHLIENIRSVAAREGLQALASLSRIAGSHFLGVPDGAARFEQVSELFATIRRVGLKDLVEALSVLRRSLLEQMNDRQRRLSGFEVGSQGLANDIFASDVVQQVVSDLESDPQMVSEGGHGGCRLLVGSSVVSA